MKIAFNGCSFTRGDGFAIEERDTALYYGQVAKHLGCDFDNNAKGGYSNLRIFHSAYADIISQKYDIVFVQWSNPNRIWMSPRPNQWYFMGSRFAPINDIRGDEWNVNKEEIDKLSDFFLLMNHDFQNLLELVTYCNILEQTAKLNNIKIIFVNGIVLWDKDLFKPLGEDLEQSLSDYSKELFDFENRDDILVRKLHKQLYDRVSTLNKNLWANLTDGMFKLMCDFAPVDGMHPGPKTHQIVADKIINHLNLFAEKG